jgi:hypothetical protein
VVECVCVSMHAWVLCVSMHAWVLCVSEYVNSSLHQHTQVAVASEIVYLVCSLGVCVFACVFVCMCV